MNISLLLFIWFLVLAAFFKDRDDEKGRSIYIILCFALLIFFSACRCLYYGQIGSDTYKYCNLFKSMHDYSWSEIWGLFLGGYVYGEEESDIGYLYFQKVISLVTSSFHLFTFIAQLMFYVPFYFCLKKYTHNITELVFALIFYTILVYGHSNTGARQFYAMGFGVLFFILCGNKKYKWAILSLLAGMTIHRSLGLVVLPFALNFLNTRHIKLIHIITFCLFPLVMIFPNEIIVFMGNIAGKEQYAEYGQNGITGGTETFIFLLEMLSFICLIGISRKMIEMDSKLKQMYAMVPCFTFFGPLIYSNGSMIRISMYMYLYLTILFPVAIKGISGKNFKPVLYCAMSALMFLALISNHNAVAYDFFWNVDPQDTW